MLRDITRSITGTIVLTIICCVVFSLVVFGIARVTFPDQASGELVHSHGVLVGSRLIGQDVTSARYFHGRPSATDTPDDAAASGASNLGPNSAALRDAVKGRIADLRTAGMHGPIPEDLVTTSASGLDPDISVAGALAQAPLVAKARGIDAATVTALVRSRERGSQLGFLGARRVNVLELNLALDSQLT